VHILCPNLRYQILYVIEILEASFMTEKQQQQQKSDLKQARRKFISCF
jgi:hypothetical protein